jgi:hypothetical protein
LEVISIANPVGLYLGKLNTDDFTLPSRTPAGAKAADFWVIERGDKIHTLRASYHLPPELGITVGDIKIDNKLIQFGGQLIDKLQIRLRAMVFAADEPVVPKPCMEIRQQPLLQPLLMVPESLPVTLVDAQLFVVCMRSPVAERVRCTDSGVTVSISSVGLQNLGGDVFQVLDLRLNGTARSGFAGLALAPAGGDFAPARPCALKFVADPQIAVARTTDMVSDRMVRDHRVPLLLKGLA